MKAICNAFDILKSVITDHLMSLTYDFITYEEHGKFLDTDNFDVEDALIDLLPKFETTSERGYYFEYAIIGIHNGKFNCIGIYDTNDNECFHIYMLDSDSKIEILHAIEDKFKLTLELLEDYRYAQP